MRARSAAGRARDRALTLLALLAAFAAAGRATTAELDDEIRGRGLEPASIVRPHRLTDEMKAWLAGRVDRELGAEARIRALLAVLVGEEGLGLQYTSGFTGTAAQVFASGEANCLSFTHLFVGMARELGLDVYYLEVKRPPQIGKEGDLVVLWEHVTAGFGPPGSRLVLEFAPGPRLSTSSTRRLSELTALAMHYSNRGAETLLAGRLEEALEWLEIAALLDPSWSHALLNLGVARRRGGDLEGAEQAYREATAADPGNFEAYHNLALLLRLRGERDASREVLRLLDRRDNRDPFIFLALGDDSLEVGRSEEAKRFYRRAAGLDPRAAAPRASLGLAALAEGRRDRARRWLERAVRRDPEDDRVVRLRRELGEQR